MVASCVVVMDNILLARGHEYYFRLCPDIHGLVHSLHRPNSYLRAKLITKHSSCFEFGVPMSDLSMTLASSLDLSGHSSQVMVAIGRQWWPTVVDGGYNTIVDRGANGG